LKMAMAESDSGLYLVVMAGGSGTRFWPKSTSKRPKQLMKFFSDESILVQTLSRFDDLVPPSNQIIVTRKALEKAVQKDVGNERVVLAEPQGRNTAPCVYWAARYIQKKDPGAVMLVMPSDSFISDVNQFRKTVRRAVEWAKNHSDLITLGINPTRPDTGYGYLQLGEPLEGECRKVSAFVEKPGLEKAKEYLKSGTTLWNGGMFVWRVNIILDAFDQHCPEYAKVWKDSDGSVDLAYPKMEATSVDYAVMEKSDHVVTFPLDCGLG